MECGLQVTTNRRHQIADRMSFPDVLFPFPGHYRARVFKSFNQFTAGSEHDLGSPFRGHSGTRSHGRRRSVILYISGGTINRKIDGSACFGPISDYSFWPSIAPSLPSDNTKNIFSVSGGGLIAKLMVRLVLD